ncbi:unnamed protein product [Phaeothamnion confervicola]
MGDDDGWNGGSVRADDAAADAAAAGGVGGGGGVGMIDAGSGGGGYCHGDAGGGGGSGGGNVGTSAAADASRMEVDSFAEPASAVPDAVPLAASTAEPEAASGGGATNGPVPPYGCKGSGDDAAGYRERDRLHLSGCSSAGGGGGGLPSAGGGMAVEEEQGKTGEEEVGGDGYITSLLDGATGAVQ